MTDVIEVEGKFYVLATSERVDDRTRVLKSGETFAVFDRHGDVQPVGMGEQGVFRGDTRFVSRMELLLGDERPLLLSSTVRQDNLALTADLTNPDFIRDGRIQVQRGTIHLLRSIFLREGCCYERLSISNYGGEDVGVELRFRFESDFADIFEVRGVPRQQRGTQTCRIEGDAVVFTYDGLDGLQRATRISAAPAPSVLSRHEMKFDLLIPARSTKALDLTIAFTRGATVAADEPPKYEAALEQAGREVNDQLAGGCGIETSNGQFNQWLDRSMADIQMMVTQTAHGPYPYAGVPWFCTAFGRDGIITALECLWTLPSLAAGVLRFLADTQADATTAERDAEPGKILHEIRHGEMAALGEIPFARYYGGVDSTPLFVILAGEYLLRSGDRDLIRRIWPNIRRALEWMDTFGDRDGDGFVEYLRESETGLVNQGWKDSGDAIFDEAGGLAEGPVALCEVQGYVYAAKRAAAHMARELGEWEWGLHLDNEAAALRERFENAFWMEDLGSYALALDGRKRPCRVLASNAGHLLFSTLPRADRARRVSETLLASESFSGWGIRTLAKHQPRFNPMAYHNGSVWPHDNAIIAQGFARYDLKDAALQVLTGMLDASRYIELHRLPELFCGFNRRPGEGPTEYPVACSPQSWAAAAVFSLLQSALGIELDAAQHELRFRKPALPESLRWVRITKLALNSSRFDLRIERTRDDVSVTITRREGDARVVVVK